MNIVRTHGRPARARALAPLGSASLADLFDSFFAGPLAEQARAASSEDFVPSLEWTDREEDYLLRAELPGMDPDHVAVEVDDDMLVLRGEKRTEERREQDKVLMTERTFGSFERRLRLPGPVDGDAIRAAMSNGVLEITLPKSNGAEGLRRIEIQR